MSLDTNTLILVRYLQGDLSTSENQALVTNLFVLFKYIGMVLGVILGDIFWEIRGVNSEN